MSAECRKNDVCIGGYARLVAVVKQLQRSRSNPIYFNAGDNYAGTIYWTFGKHNISSYFLNLLPADVMTIGNHEFDGGPDGLVPFLDRIESPLVLANVDFTDEPQLQGKFLNSTILIRDGRKIGVIGVIANDTHTLSKTGKVKFLNEVDTVRYEADKLDKEGVDIIVVLSHCGIDVDFEIARGAGSKIDVIVGAHTHTFMYTGDPPGPDTPEYDYPAVVKHSNGHNVLIVQASAYAKYVGDMTVYFDGLGEAIRWTGQPIFLGHGIQPDEEIVRELNPWKEKYENITQQPIATTYVTLDNSNCLYAECIMGNVVADAFLSSYRSMSNDTKTAIALVQSGAIRTTLVEGPISFGDLIMVVPFHNRVDSFDLLGRYIWEALEYSSNEVNNENTHLKQFLQISGLRLVVNATQPKGHRVVAIEILCEECTPVEYKPIDLNQTYRVVATDFLANGGNGYTMFSEHMQNYAMGEIDVDALSNYIKSIEKVEEVETGRIIVLT
ncbi:apyrase-like isoform X2 [Sitodiplosis mosellana]|nr:apyrase-like isoform X2 [Sitodiplosis mosellana]XP_055326817.1 apyrase-like isoform X2 [Sitodiplosis mosellana]